MAPSVIKPSDIRAQRGLDAFVRPTATGLSESPQVTPWKSRMNGSEYTSPRRNPATTSSATFDVPSLRAVSMIPVKNNAVTFGESRTPTKHKRPTPAQGTRIASCVTEGGGGVWDPAHTASVTNGKYPTATAHKVTHNGYRPFGCSELDSESAPDDTSTSRGRDFPDSGGRDDSQDSATEAAIGIQLTGFAAVLKPLDRNGDGKLTIADLFHQNQVLESEPGSEPEETMNSEPHKEHEAVREEDPESSTEPALAPAAEPAHEEESRSAPPSDVSPLAGPDIASEVLHAPHITESRNSMSPKLAFSDDALQSLSTFKEALNAVACSSRRCSSARASHRSTSHNPLKSAPRSEMPESSYWGRARASVSIAEGPFWKEGKRLPEAPRLPPTVQRRGGIHTMSTTNGQCNGLADVTIAASQAAHMNRTTPREESTRMRQKTTLHRRSSIKARPLDLVNSMPCVDTEGGITERTRISLVEHVGTHSEFTSQSKLSEATSSPRVRHVAVGRPTEVTPASRFRNTTTRKESRRSHLFDEQDEQQRMSCIVAEISVVPSTIDHSAHTDTPTCNRQPVVALTRVLGCDELPVPGSSGAEDGHGGENDGGDDSGERENTQESEEEDGGGDERSATRSVDEVDAEECVLDDELTSRTNSTTEELTYHTGDASQWTENKSDIGPDTDLSEEDEHPLRESQGVHRKSCWTPRCAGSNSSAYTRVRNARVPHLKLDTSSIHTDSSRSNYSLSTSLFDKIHGDQLEYAAQFEQETPHYNLEDVVLEPENDHRPRQYTRLSTFVHAIDCDASGIISWKERQNAIIRLTPSDPYFRATTGFYTDTDILHRGLKTPLLPVVSVRFCRLVEAPGGGALSILLRVVGLQKLKLDLVLVCRADAISKSVVMILAFEIREPGNDTPLVQRRLHAAPTNAKKRRALKMPDLMFTPSVFRTVSHPTFPKWGTYASTKQRVIQAWRHFGRVSDRDWASYNQLLDIFNDEYSHCMALTTRR